MLYAYLAASTYYTYLCQLICNALDFKYGRQFYRQGISMYGFDEVMYWQQ